MRKKSKSETSVNKDSIQKLVRAIVIKRDGTCVLRKLRHCNDSVMQADHLITRSNSATYADTRLIVCICRSCHGWKHWHEKEYDALVKTVLPEERLILWDRCQQELHAHKTKKMDWVMEIVALEQELKGYE